MKKVLPLLLAAGMVIGTIGCSKDTEKEGTETKPAKKDEMVTYQMFRKFAAPEYPEDGGPGKKVILDALAKAGITNVDYKVELTAGSEYNTKLNLKAASGQLPDMVHFDKLDYPTFIRMAGEGLLLPLNDYLAKSPNITKMIDPAKLDYVTVDGKIYAVPTGARPEPYNLESREGFLVRQDWLDKLGLKQPQTLGEFYEVMKAFTNNDPDGNGKKDTIAYTSDKDQEFDGIFGAFGINPLFWHERDGKIKKGFVLPETKEALATLQKWYKEGLIDPQFLVTEIKQRNENLINSKYGIMQYTALDIDPKTATAGALYKANPNAKLSFIAGPKGTTGKSGFPEASPINQIRGVSAKVKDPEKLFKMLDWMQSDEGGFNLIHYGVDGEDHTFDKAKNAIVQKSTYPELYKKGYSNPVRFLNDIDVRWASDVVKENLLKLPGTHIKNEFWKPVAAEIDYPDLEKKLWKEYFAKIITGEYSVDKWDEFVQNYYKQGGELVEKQANEEWKKMKAAKKK